MRRWIARYILPATITASAYALCLLALFGCAGDKFFDQLTSLSSPLSGYIVVASTQTNPSTAPGAVALFDPNGTFVRTLADYFASIEVPTGLAVFGGSAFFAVDGADRVEVVRDVLTSASTTYLSSSGIASAPLRQMAIDTSGNLFIAEYNTGNGQIEKIDYTGSRTGSPFINTTTGSCVLLNPWGITYIPATNRIVVTNYTAGGKLLIYDATTGGCISAVTNAAYSASNPTGIVYHPQTNKLLMGRIGDHAIYTMNVDGTSPTVAYQNSSRVSLPYTLAVDSSGYVYIGASGQDDVEKFSFNGTTLTPVLSGPLIGPSVYTQNPTQISVFP